MKEACGEEPHVIIGSVSSDGEDSKSLFIYLLLFLWASSAAAWYWGRIQNMWTFLHTDQILKLAVETNNSQVAKCLKCKQAGQTFGIKKQGTNHWIILQY